MEKTQRKALQTQVLQAVIDNLDFSGDGLELIRTTAIKEKHRRKEAGNQIRVSCFIELKTKSNQKISAEACIVFLTGNDFSWGVCRDDTLQRIGKLHSEIFNGIRSAYRESLVCLTSSRSAEACSLKVTREGKERLQILTPFSTPA